MDINLLEFLVSPNTGKRFLKKGQIYQGNDNNIEEESNIINEFLEQIKQLQALIQKLQDEIDKIDTFPEEATFVLKTPHDKIKNGLSLSKLDNGVVFKKEGGELEGKARVSVSNLPNPGVITIAGINVPVPKILVGTKNEDMEASSVLGEMMAEALLNVNRITFPGVLISGPTNMLYPSSTFISEPGIVLYRDKKFSAAIGGTDFVDVEDGLNAGKLCVIKDNSKFIGRTTITIVDGEHIRDILSVSADVLNAKSAVNCGEIKIGNGGFKGNTGGIGDTLWKLPSRDGNDGDCLATDGNLNLKWVKIVDEETIKKIKEECEKARDEAKEYARKSEEINRKVEQIKNEVEQAKTEIDAIKVEVDEAKTVCEEAKTVCEEAQTVCEEAQTVCEEAQGVCETAQGVCETAQGVCETAQGVCETAQGVCEAAQGVCEEAQAATITSAAEATTAAGEATTAAAESTEAAGESTASAAASAASAVAAAGSATAAAFLIGSVKKKEDKSSHNKDIKAVNTRIDNLQTEVNKKSNIAIHGTPNEVNVVNSYDSPTKTNNFTISLANKSSNIEILGTDKQTIVTKQDNNRVISLDEDLIKNVSFAYDFTNKFALTSKNKSIDINVLDISVNADILNKIEEIKQSIQVFADSKDILVGTHTDGRSKLVFSQIVNNRLDGYDKSINSLGNDLEQFNNSIHSDINNINNEIVSINNEIVSINNNFNKINITSKNDNLIVTKGEPYNFILEAKANGGTVHIIGEDNRIEVTKLIGMDLVNNLVAVHPELAEFEETLINDTGYIIDIAKDFEQQLNDKIDDFGNKAAIGIQEMYEQSVAVITQVYEALKDDIEQNKIYVVSKNKLIDIQQTSGIELAHLLINIDPSLASDEEKLAKSTGFIIDLNENYLKQMFINVLKEYKLI